MHQELNREKRAELKTRFENCGNEPDCTGFRKGGPTVPDRGAVRELSQGVRYLSGTRSRGSRVHTQPGEFSFESHTSLEVCSVQILFQIMTLLFEVQRGKHVLKTTATDFRTLRN